MVWDFRPKVTIHLQQTGESYPCAMTETLLAGMVRLGGAAYRLAVTTAAVASAKCGCCRVKWNTSAGQPRPCEVSDGPHVGLSRNPQNRFGIGGDGQF